VADSPGIPKKERKHGAGIQLKEDAFSGKAGVENCSLDYEQK
jgi:hypothetical protein